MPASSPDRIDPHLLDVLHDGRYFVTAPKIDPRALVVIAPRPRAPKPWTPSVYDDRPGIIGELLAVLHRP